MPSSSRGKPPILLLTILCLAAFLHGRAQVRQSYDNLWKTVDSLSIGQGRVRSALDIVQSIYARAQNDGNAPQVIKALLYRMQLEEPILDNAGSILPAMLEAQADSLSGPARAIVQSIAAEAYWNYFKQHRFTLYSRTSIQEGNPSSDISTWTIRDFHKRIGALYRASLSDPSLLQHTRISTFDTILEKGNARHLRPALFDLLAARAITYFSDGERTVDQPAYYFALDDSSVLAPVPLFIDHKFRAADSSDLHWKALLLYRDLLRFHEKDIRPDAFIDADLNRITFAFRYATADNKAALYVSALEGIITAYPHRAAAAQASYLLAQHYSQEGNLYGLSFWDDTPGDTLNRWSLNKALALCDPIIREFPASEAGINAKMLADNIRIRQISLKTENVNLPGQPFRAYVQYKNISRLSFRILKATPAALAMVKNLEADHEKLVRISPIRTWKQPLPDPGDHQDHWTEVKIDALPVGSYILLASGDGFFGGGKDPLICMSLEISGIGWIAGDNSRYFVLDRETGAPLPGAQVRIWRQIQDYRTRKDSLSLLETHYTDKDGQFKADKVKGGLLFQSSFRFQITAGKDSLFEANSYYVSFSNDGQAPRSAPRPEMFVFTDRGIYRPGQTLYFKALGVIRDSATGNNALYIPRDSIRFYLEDLEGRKTDSLELLPGDFGTVSGTFRLPAGGSTGIYRIRAADASSASFFAVEQYKRPRFNVTFDSLRSLYRVGDTMHVKGTALTYAGNPVNGAKVRYTIRRTARLPLHWYPGIVHPRLDLGEIAHGDTTTRADGSFSIAFAALPDQNLREQDPVYDYVVRSEVTDINGETQAGDDTVSAGYVTTLLRIKVPPSGKVNTDSLRSLSIESMSLNNIPQETPVRITIVQLRPPGQMIRPRYWHVPDQFTMDKETYHRLFPHDDYYRETDFSTWPVASRILEDAFTTGPGKPFLLDNKRLAPGVYKVDVAGADHYGRPIHTGAFLQVYDPLTGQLPFPAYQWGLVEKDRASPGDSAVYLLGSSAKKVFLVQQERSNAGTGFSTAALSPDGLLTPLAYGAQKQGFTVAQAFVLDNRFYTEEFQVSVPPPSGRLHIHYTTFRNKLEPGGTEHWSLSVSGPGKKGAAGAEVLVSMYDASLDQFMPGNWQIPQLSSEDAGSPIWIKADFSQINPFASFSPPHKYPVPYIKVYDQILYPGLQHVRFSPGLLRQGKVAMMEDMDKVASPGYFPGVPAGYGNKAIINIRGRAPKEISADSSAVSDDNPGYGSPNPPVPVLRSHFNETAFFYPDLHTDSAGNVRFTFTVPDALTSWHLQTFAHTRDLDLGLDSKRIVTRKTLMLLPNIPRFVREGDQIELTTKIANLDTAVLSGQVHLALLDAATMQPVDQAFGNRLRDQPFTTGPGVSTAVHFPLTIPAGYDHPLIYRLTAAAGDFSDGEQGGLPVLSRRLLVTESLPMLLKGDSTRHFRLDRLLQASSDAFSANAPSGPIPYRLTLEYSSNPAWYAVQALPALAEASDECAEYAFNRYYAGAIGSGILGSAPSLRAVMDSWRKDTTGALASNLEKNGELKSALLEETPWVLDGTAETAQKQRLASFLDPSTLEEEQASAISHLRGLQKMDGAFAWFKGGMDDQYITQYIVTGLGHLRHLRMISRQDQSLLEPILQGAIDFMDAHAIVDDNIHLKGKVTSHLITPLEIQYVYARSFFQDHPILPGTRVLVNYYLDLARKQWLERNKYEQGMLALALYRFGDTVTAQKILASLEETSIDNPETGRYWKSNSGGWYWYESSIETQSLLIEAFAEIERNTAMVNELRAWLLTQKQTQAWSTAKATADACYALLLQGSDWLSSPPAVQVRLGDTTVDSRSLHTIAGTGYFKRQWDGTHIRAAMGNIQVTPVVKGRNSAVPISWGAVYYQYFQDMDSITAARTGLSVQKQLYTVSNTDRGEEMRAIKEGDRVHIGDKVRVRLVLASDRDLDYVHLKDLRAACMEPLSVLSGYRWQGDLSYYQSTLDLSTNCYFSRLSKGTHVLEYDLYVSQAGVFSSGIATLQCLYAPQFTAHSEGVTVKSEP